MRIRYKTLLIKSIYLFIDFVLIYSAIALACLLRQNTVTFNFTYLKLITDHENPFRFVIIFWILILMLLFNSNDLYRTRREFFKGFEVWLVVKSVFIASILSVVVIYGFKIHGFPRSIFFIGTILNIVFLCTWRLLKRSFVNYLVANGYNNFNVLIIGAGKVGVLLKREIKKHPELGLRVVGFLDDFKTNDPKNPDIKILGKLSNFIKVVRKEFIRKVFITIHHDSELFLNMLEQAKVLGVAVRVIPEGFELISGDFLKHNIGMIPVLEYSDVRPIRLQIGKRLFDFIASLFGLIILSPLFLILAIFIKKDSKGSIFYKSKRYGYHGRMFNMYKFRSMINNADDLIDQVKEKNEVDGPIFKIRNDPRMTKMGRFLRKYSMDELPQIFNVLRGDMSLVGPRPLPIHQIEREDLKQLKRLEVRPGITGLWQIKGRSDISFARLLRWDTWYINNWSFWLDLNILLQTIPVVFKGKGAY